MTFNQDSNGLLGGNTNILKPPMIMLNPQLLIMGDDTALAQASSQVRMRRYKISSTIQ
jgi:hypothetical protein